MVFEHIEELKRVYTDKFVIVDGNQPDLKRFDGITGTVKTVNMSGRALVQFDAYDNIGWYDIDVDHLKIIDKPLAKPEIKEKAAPEKKASPKTDAKKPAAKMSVEEMLAAARGQAAPAAKTSKPAAAEPAAEKPKAKAKAKPAAMSTADILAAARGGQSAAAKADPPASDKADPPVAKEAAPQPAKTESAAAAVADTTPRTELPKNVADIVAFCRKQDSK